jgi:hypothetical protein
MRRASSSAAPGGEQPPSARQNDVRSRNACFGVRKEGRQIGAVSGDLKKGRTLPRTRARGMTKRQDGALVRDRQEASRNALIRGLFRAFKLVQGPRALPREATARSRLASAIRQRGRTPLVSPTGDASPGCVTRHVGRNAGRRLPVSRPHPRPPSSGNSPWRRAIKVIASYNCRSSSIV